MNTDNKISDKSIRLIEYLNVLARINTKTVRSLDEYRKILWVHNIPYEPKYCFTQAWGQKDDYDDEVWIEVKKCKEPELPKIPSKCMDWVKHEMLQNTQDLPELYETIVIQMEEEDPETGERFNISKTISLSDNPEVEKAWEVYLDKQWLPWSELYNKYAKVQKAEAWRTIRADFLQGTLELENSKRI